MAAKHKGCVVGRVHRRKGHLYYVTAGGMLIEKKMKNSKAKSGCVAGSNMVEPTLRRTRSRPKKSRKAKPRRTKARRTAKQKAATRHMIAVNRSRASRPRRTKARRTAKQKAATRHMIAVNRKRARKNRRRR